jgi:hypothetical protein
LESSGLFAVLREGIGPVEDRIALRRETRWLEMVAEVVEFWKARDVPAAAIRDKTLRAVYEYASLEEDLDMAQLWVKLLAGALGGTDAPAGPGIERQCCRYASWSGSDPSLFRVERGFIVRGVIEAK